jgi:hypothetical protein
LNRCIFFFSDGLEYPWINNVAPESNKFEGYLQGNVKPEWGYYPFYTYFSSPTGCSVSKGNKPFFIPETGSTYHFDWANKTKHAGEVLPNLDVSRVTVKQAWWRQFMSSEFLAKYPRIKAVCFFEFVKTEEETWRDFSNFGASPGGSEKEAGEVAQAFVADMKTSMPFLKFAGPAPNVTGGLAPTSAASVDKKNAADVVNPGSWIVSILVGVAGALFF